MTGRRYASDLVVKQGCGDDVVSGSFASCGDWIKNVQTFDALALEHAVTIGDALLELSETCEWCGWHKQLVTDHCHGCGRIRGTLCRTCNLLEANGRTKPGWESKCDGQPLYLGGWTATRDVELSPQWCGGKDAFAVALRAWWRSANPDVWLEAKHGE